MPNLFSKLIHRHKRPDQGGSENHGYSKAVTLSSQSTGEHTTPIQPTSPIESKPSHVDSGTSAKPALLPPVSTAQSSQPPAIDTTAATPSLPQRLWDEAYEKIKQDDSKLIDAYERILTPALKSGDTSSDADLKENAIDQNPIKRWSQMEQLAKAALLRTQKEDSAKAAISGAMQGILSIKDMISWALEAVPHAAMAWTGVCFVLQVFSNPGSESGAKRKGMAYVIGRMKWYCALSTLLLAETSDSRFSVVLDQLRDRIVDLYKSLLSYLIKSVCSCYKNRVLAFFRDSIKLDDWGYLGAIQSAENSLRKDSDAYNSNQNRAQLEQLLDHAKAGETHLSDISQTLHEQVSREMSKQDSDCLKDLRLTDPRDEKVRIERTKGGLLKESSRWVFANDDFRRWRAGESQLLWIKGDPGKGKTMLLISIIDELTESSKQSDDDPPAFFLCQETASDLNRATAVLRGLLWLAIHQQNSPDKRQALISHMRKDYDSSGKQLFADSNAFIALSRIFKCILGDLNSTGANFIVDALDECVKDLPALLELIVEVLVEYPRVKWLVSSRHRPDMERKLRCTKFGEGLSLEAYGSLISQAINFYIDEQLSGLDSLQDNVALQDRVRKTIREKADGTFLWVALVCKELRDREDSEYEEEDVIEVLEEVPSGLKELYQRMMARMESLGNDTKYCHTILSIITTVYRPLHLLELSALSGLEGRLAETTSLTRIIHKCGSFLTVRDDYVYFVHQSAKDFLIKSFAKIAPAGPPSVHRDLFSRSLVALSRTLRRNIYDLPYPGFKASDIQAPSPDPLISVAYSSIYWVSHLRDSLDQYSGGKGSDDGDSVDSAVLFFLKAHFLHWIESLNLLKEPSGGILLVKSLLEAIKSIPNTTRPLRDFLKEAERFARTYRAVGEQAPLQTYAAALIFCPTQSEIKKSFWEERLPSLKHVKGVAEHWDLWTQVLEGHGWPVMTVAFSPDGTTVASGSINRTIRLWDAATGAQKKILENQREPDKSVTFNAVAFLSDSKSLVSASNDNMAQLWDVSTGLLKRTFEGHSDEVLAVAISPDDTILASASEDQTIRLWGLASGAEKHMLPGHSGAVRAVAFSPDSKMLVSASDDKTIRIWDVNGDPKQTLQGHDDSVTGLSFLPGGTKFASASYDGTIRLWDTLQGVSTQTLDAHADDRLYSLAFSPNGATLVSGSGGSIHIWNMTTGIMVRRLKVGDSDYVSSVSFSPNGETLASASNDGYVRFWDTTTIQLPEVTAENSTLDCHDNGVEDLAFSPDYATIASASRDKTVRLWDVMTGTTKQVFKGHEAEVMCVAFSPDGTTLASGSADRKIRLWEKITGKLKLTLEGHKNDIRSIAFSPDSRILSSASADKTIRLWDTDKGNLKLTLTGHEDRVSQVAFSPDGTTVASKSWDGTVRLWDVEKGTQRRSLNNIYFFTLSFSSDGRYLEDWDGVRFDLDASESDARVEEDPPRHGLYAGRNWISRDGRDVVWLPPEFKYRCRVVGGNTVVLGHAGGRVIFLEFPSS